MSDTKKSEVKKAFIKFNRYSKEVKDNELRDGYYEILSDNPRLKIKTGKNIITLPDHAWIKIKESDQ